MNYTEFDIAPNGFPLESDATFGFMQKDYQSAIRGLAAISGSNFLIISGCEIAEDNTVSGGWLWLNDDIVKFIPGNLASHIIIQETTDQKANQDGQMYDRYITKIARFGTGANQLPFANFKRLPSIQQLGNIIEDIAKGSLYEGEDWVIIKGLNPDAFFTELNGGLALYKGQLVNASAPSLFPSEANPLYLTPRGQWLTTADPSYLKFEPFTSQRSETLRRNHENPKGAIHWTKTLQAIHFDNGLGKNEWLGWAVANGDNGTLDLSTAVPGLTAIQRL